MSYYDNETLCPKCGQYSTSAEMCEHCGALIAKIRERELYQDQNAPGEATEDQKPLLEPLDKEPEVSITAITVVIIMLGILGGISYYRATSDKQETRATSAEEILPPAAKVAVDPQDPPIYNFPKATEAAEDDHARKPALRAKTETGTDEPGLLYSIAGALRSQSQGKNTVSSTADAPVPAAEPATAPGAPIAGEQLASAQPPSATIDGAPTRSSNPGSLAPITIGEGDISSSNFSLKASEQPKKQVATPIQPNPSAATANTAGLGKRSVMPVDSRSFNREVLTHSSEPVLVDFYATWCGPCKRLAPQLEVFAGLNDDVKVVKVDIDQSRDLAMKYKIQSVPTLVLFKNGEMLGRNSGVPSMSELQASVQPYL